MSVIFVMVKVKVEVENKLANPNEERTEDCDMCNGTGITQ